MSTITDKLKELKRPLPLKWRVSRAFPNKMTPTHVIMVGYIDSRDVQTRLDDVVGAENWQTEYFECRGKQFCKIGINVDGQWVWKADNGSPSQTEAGKGETSDSFKRAAVHWGINRNAYNVGEVKLPCRMYDNKPYPCDENNNFLKGDALYALCNKLAKVDEMEVEFDRSFTQFDGIAEQKQAQRQAIKRTTSKKVNAPQMP